MKIVIVGAGEVGLSIARHLVQDNHSVTIIEKDEARAEFIRETLDVSIIVGFGSHPDMLERAGCENANIIIAATASDEVNMLACQMAHALFKVPTKIARVRDASYLSVVRYKVFNDGSMPVDEIISPEIEVAQAVLRTMSVAGAVESVFMGGGIVHMLGVHITPQSADVINVPLHELESQRGVNLKVVAIFRHGRLIVPNRADHIEMNDEVYFICLKYDTAAAMQVFGYEETSTHRVLVIGGGKTGFVVCRELEKLGINTRVIEQDRTKAEWLAANLQNTTVIHGDAMSRSLLVEENVMDMDVVACMTENDATNILAAVQVQNIGVKNVIALIKESNLMPLAEGLGIDKLVTPREITAARILRYVRQGRIYTLHTVNEGKAEVFEVEISADSGLIGSPLGNLDLPYNTTVAAVINGEQVDFVNDKTVLKAGQRVIVMAEAGQVPAIEKLL